MNEKNKQETVPKSQTYFENWANLFTGATPCCREVHHHQLVSSLLQDGPEIILQELKRDVYYLSFSVKLMGQLT